ncbi:hypothetical protein Rhopal_006831-T1 [Rhodotorula paludigena]|uniref:Eukaryotic membrane protein family-domain-containing protein n=1 Tax=Rhodotorula paludigena TaxID=86838 RepID=A0AAV5GZ47_9BASI|nr:hypothetical protein Rhopal_006831-T1 [Rhodotorula paludigena]
MVLPASVAHSRSLPDLSLGADPLSDDDEEDEQLSVSPAADHDEAHHAARTNAPLALSPSPPDSPRLLDGLGLPLARRSNEWADESGAAAGGGGGGGVEDTQAGHTPRTERSLSLGSIHSAPEFALPPGETHDGEAEAADETTEGLSSPEPASPALLSDHDAERATELVQGREGEGGAHAVEGKRAKVKFGSTLWDYLQEEVFTVEMDGEEGIVSERVTNFLAVPRELEKIIVFGVFICLDSFLYTFTILPLRALAAFVRLVSNQAHNLVLRFRRNGAGKKRYLRLSHKCDLTKAAIFVGTLLLLHRVTDASKMYHGVRGQETIKLYVLFNVLEIADRLCCSFGQDLQDSLFSRQTFGRRTDGSHPHMRPLALFGLTLAYVVAHSLVLFYQLITLNVAVNSYSNALLTLLLSNQFVEIKGSVFKKFEKENLFQLTCADIVERFQLGLMLFIISLRNLIARSSLPSLSLLSYLPSASALSLSASLSLVHQTFSPAVVVLVSECFVDWLKHAFITKFNHIRPGVYGRFVDVLCKDLVAGSAAKSGGARQRGDEPFVDQSPLVARRLGFAALPLSCLVVRVIAQAFEMLSDESGVDECALPSPAGGLGPHGSKWGRWWAAEVGAWVGVALAVGVGWVCLVALKLLIGINLRAFASARWSTQRAREGEELLASRERAKIGVTAHEAELDAQVERLLRDDRFDTAYKGRKIELASLGRYDMVKSRLW